jgi:Protein of unknown function (DUF2975)
MNANEISPKANVRLNRIQKVGGILKTIFFIVTILCIVGGVGLCFAFFNFHGVKKIEFALDAGFEFTCAICSSFCCKIFDLYSRGELFSVKIVHAIQRVGYAYFLMAFVGFISRIVSVHFGLQASKINSEWQWSSLLSLLTSLFPGLLILFIAWIMDEGRKIQEEQELTV